MCCWTSRAQSGFQDPRASGSSSCCSPTVSWSWPCDDARAWCSDFCFRARQACLLEDWHSTHSLRSNTPSFMKWHPWFWNKCLLLCSQNTSKNAFYFKWFLQQLYFVLFRVDFFFLRLQTLQSVHLLTQSFIPKVQIQNICFHHGSYVLDFFFFHLHLTLVFRLTKLGKWSPLLKPTHWKVLQFDPPPETWSPSRIVQGVELVISWTVKKFWSSGDLFVLETLRLFLQLMESCGNLGS